MNVRNVFAVLLLCTGLAADPQAARAAQSYDNCNSFIDTLPATISTQGVWCLRKDLATNISSGNAIEIAANNVTIDCNDFKVGGLAGGDGSLSVGIRASDRQNATVRHCGIRGFYYGVYLDGGGHVVEDNRLDSNLLISILVQGDNNTVQRNRVYDTGGALGQNTATGISAYAHILDNTVSGVFAVATDTTLFGIRIYGVGNEARDNRVSGLEAKGNGLPYGIDVHSSGIVDGNRIIATTATFGSGYGIYSGGGSIFVCKDNVANGFQAGVGISGCTTSSGDVAIP